MIRMHVIGLTVDNSTKTPLVVLQDEDGHEVLPIWIGAMEAMAISLALSGSILPRPLTHDLLLNALTKLGGRMEGVEIHDMREGTYHADLLLRHDGSVQRIDCRPSDAIALALRVGVPIDVHSAVLRHATEARQNPGEPSSARLLQPQDAATDMMRQAAARMTAAMTAEQEAQGSKHSASGPTRSASHAHSHAGENDNAEEQRLAELLQMLEPDSSRRM